VDSHSAHKLSPPAAPVHLADDVAVVAPASADEAATTSAPAAADGLVVLQTAAGVETAAAVPLPSDASDAGGRSDFFHSR
jgi:hypothetical protein